MRKRALKLLVLLIIYFPFIVFAYTDGDEPVATSKVYNFLIDDFDSEDVIRLYNPENTIIPSYFNLNDNFYEEYGFHIPVANQKNLGLCDMFASIKSIETNYALKKGKYIDLSERYSDFMTSKDFLGRRALGYLCENNICEMGDSSNFYDTTAIIQTFGAPLEKEIPYVNYDENDYDLFNNSKNILKVNSFISFPYLQNVENQIAKDEWKNILKIHIMKYGSIDAAVCAPKKDIYNSGTASAYQSGSCPNEGHGVSIVGWDDSYSKDNFKVAPEHDGAYIVLNSWGESWGDNGYYYISYEDNNVLVDLEGTLDVVEAKKYNMYSKSSKMLPNSGGHGISEYGSLQRFTAMKFNRVRDNEYLSHIAISASDIMATNTSTKVKFYLNPIDDTFDKEKLIYLGEELPTNSVTIITLDEPIKLTGSTFALVYEVTGDTTNFFYKNAVDKDGNLLHGFTYTTKGWNQTWSLLGNSYAVFPAFVFTVDGIVKDASIKTEPTKKTYIKGQPIDLNGGVLDVTYDDNTTTEIDMTDSAVKLYDYDTTILGTQKVTLLYEGKLLTYNITVKNDLESISIKTNPNKIVYLKGEELDLSEGVITATYSDNSTEDIQMDDSLVTVTGYNKNTVGAQELTVTYKSKTTKFSVTVINRYYIVTFDSNGGSEVPWLSILAGETVSKPINPKRDGYTFKEWKLNGNTYDFNTPVTSNITLKAEWDNNTLKDILENNGYVVNNSYASKFTLGESITAIKNQLGNNITIESKATIISTGTVIRKGNESYTVIIQGDLTGDGKINSGDLLQMRKYLLEEISLTGAYKMAGIIESNNEIKSLDLLRLRQYLLGEYNLK